MSSMLADLSTLSSDVSLVLKQLQHDLVGGEIGEVDGEGKPLPDPLLNKDSTHLVGAWVRE